jgi:DNA-binding GntR family transcriptional regulator
MNSRKLNSTEVANFLRNDILSGRLLTGHRLTEAELSKRFDVGRGRVREAIQQLVRQGLLETRPNRGATVAAEAPNAICDLVIPIRRTLEVYALESIFETLDETVFRRWEEILETMHDACLRQDYPGIAEADFAFHRLIFEKAGQPDLLVIWETILGIIRPRFFRTQWRAPQVLNIYEEHRQLLEAFRGNDRAVATRALANKIR